MTCFLSHLSSLLSHLSSFIFPLSSFIFPLSSLIKHALGVLLAEDVKTLKARIAAA